MIKVVGKSSHAEGVLEGEAASKAAADKAEDKEVKDKE